MKKGLTELVFIIDRSSAMSGLEEEVISGFKSMLSDLQDKKVEVVITTVLSGDRYELFHDRVHLQGAKPLAREGYTARGGTALLDGIGRAIHKTRAAVYGTKEEFRAEKTLFLILTAGRENASRIYTEDMVRQRVKHQKKKYGWEFLFFGVGMDASKEAEKIGIDAGMVREYRADPEGIREACRDMSAVSAFYCARGMVGKDAPEHPEKAGYEPGNRKKRWGSEAVLTGEWRPDTAMEEVPVEELLPGEVTAHTFQTGCYTVRGAWRVYNVYDPGYNPEGETPAAREDVELVRKDTKMEPAERYRGLGRDMVLADSFPKWHGRLRLTYEISARHSASPVPGFTCICRAAEAISHRWSESVEAVYARKENDRVPDEYASLFVSLYWMGDASSSTTYYKLDPIGNVTVQRPGAYGIMPDDADFE